MNKIWKGMKLVVAALCLAGLVILVMATKKAKSDLSVGELQVAFENPEIRFIDQLAVQNSILHLIDTSGNTKLKEIDVVAIEEKVKENVYVEDCKVYINNSRKIKIEVLQRQPLLRVINNNGVSYYLDEMGVKFPITSTFTSNVPVATGYIQYQTDSLGNLGPGAINDLITLCKYIEDNEFLSSLISQIVVNRSGEMELIPRTGNHTILLGKPEELDDKFRRLLVFYKEGLSRVGWETYTQVNLKYKGQVIAKKK